MTKAPKIKPNSNNKTEQQLVSKFKKHQLYIAPRFFIGSGGIQSSRGQQTELSNPDRNAESV